jgi:hypothetical protein
MALFRTLIRAAATRVVRSGHTVVGDDDSRLFGGLRLANDYIADVHGESNMFATVFAASIDVFGGGVRWVNAGHDPAPVIVGAGGVRLRLEPTGPALGSWRARSTRWARRGCRPARRWSPPPTA